MRAHGSERGSWQGGADEEGEESEEEALDGGAGVEAEFLAALEGDGAGQRLFVETDVSALPRARPLTITAQRSRALDRAGRGAVAALGR